MTVKYGEPTEEIKRELSSLYEYCDNDGEALELGYLAFLTTWKFEETEISIILTQLNYKVTPFIKITNTTFIPPVDTSGL